VGTKIVVPCHAALSGESVAVVTCHLKTRFTVRREYDDLEINLSADDVWRPYAPPAPCLAASSSTADDVVRQATARIDRVDAEVVRRRSDFIRSRRAELDADLDWARAEEACARAHANARTATAEAEARHPLQAASLRERVDAVAHAQRALDDCVADLRRAMEGDGGGRRGGLGDAGGKRARTTTTTTATATATATTSGRPAAE
jgi:hypothetical protein